MPGELTEYLEAWIFQVSIQLAVIILPIIGILLLEVFIWVLDLLDGRRCRMFFGFPRHRWEVAQGSGQSWQQCKRCQAGRW